MNKFYTLALALFAGTLAFGQISYDLQFDLVTPTSGSTVPGTAAVSVDFTLTNNGPDAIPTGDTLFFIYTNGTGTQIFSLTNVSLQASGFILSSDFTSGGTISGSLDLGGPFSFDLSAFPNGEICNVGCVGAGSDALSQTGDANELNMLDNFDSFIVSQTSGIDELTAGTLVYPNPALNVLNVKTSEQVASITVIGLDGSVVATSQASTQVDVSTLVPGIYVYQVEMTSGTVVKDKFVKQ